MKKLIYSVMVGGMLFPSLLLTAPLDEFLTAKPGFEPWHGEMEVGKDMMNGKVDFFGFRKGKEDPRSNAIGDYDGMHLRGGLALTRRIWVDGGVWKRKVTTPYEKGETTSLHGAVQYQVIDTFGNFPTMALRLSKWRDTSSEAIKGSPTPISFGENSMIVQQIRVEDPWDDQLQLDLINTWDLSQHASFSLFVSYGKSKVGFNNIYITDPSTDFFSAPGQFSIKRIENADSIGIEAQCVNPCGSWRRFSMTSPNGNNLSQGMNIGYDSHFYQAGGMYSWLGAEWRAKLGYRFIKLNRDVDVAVAQMPKKVIDSNHFLTMEVGYKPPYPLFEHIGFFVRPEFMTNQFIGDVPFTYNAFSAHKFDRKYGIVTVGVVGGF